MHHPTDRIAHTTTFITPVVEHWLELEIAQWVHPMKDRSDNPSHHERTLLPRSYISLLGLLFLISNNVSFISNIPAERMSQHMAFIILVMEQWLGQEIARWVHLEWLIQQLIAPWVLTTGDKTMRSKRAINRSTNIITSDQCFSNIRLATNP